MGVRNIGFWADMLIIFKLPHNFFHHKFKRAQLCNTKATFTRYRTNFRPVEKLTVYSVRTEPCNTFALFTRNLRTGWNFNVCLWTYKLLMRRGLFPRSKMAPKKRKVDDSGNEAKDTTPDSTERDKYFTWMIFPRRAIKMAASIFSSSSWAASHSRNQAFTVKKIGRFWCSDVFRERRSIFRPYQLKIRPRFWRSNFWTARRPNFRTFSVVPCERNP